MTATVVPSVIVNLKVLSKDNYKEWSFRVKTYLLAEDLWDVVEVTTEPPKEGEANFNAWSKDNAKALHTIHISCGDNAYAFIEDISVAKDAWVILAKEFSPAEVSHDADTEIEAVEGGESINGYWMNEALTEYVDALKWDAIMEFIKIHPEAVRARHPSHYTTALHHAANAEEVDNVKELVQLMTMEDLEIKEKFGNTALSVSVRKMDTDKMIEIARCQVEKNTKLLTIVDSQDCIPLLSAFARQRWKMTAHIYSVMRRETLSDRDAAQLVASGFVHRRLDIPLDLIRHNPSLGITEDHGGKPPFLTLANTRFAFLSGSRLKFWERWIYDYIHVEPTTGIMDFKKEATTNINDVCIDVQTQGRCQGNHSSVGHFFRGLVVTNLLQLVGINRLYRMKLFHVQSLQILKCICDEVLKTKDVQHDNILVFAIFRAVQLGQVEFMTHIFQTNPTFRYLTDVDGRNLFQFAAECRQEKIFSLIYGFHTRQQNLLAMKDKFGNLVLHSIGKFSSLAQIDHIQGAALQMQRELQWFKEGESISHPYAGEVVNIYNLRPRELFTQTHRELMKEGEKSMKETATSSTVVGALIVTMMFAVAFTVPGGNGDKGLPNFLERKAFKIFIASDAISLFFSTTSVMIFLGMLTSRYGEDDFLKSLPTKMILGLSTLFISIAAMMIAFSSAMFLMVPGKSWIAFLAVLLSTVPIASFVWMQFPLLVEIFISTYGAGPFNRKVQPWGPNTEQKCSTGKSNLVTKICSSFLCRKVKQWQVGHK